jgi:hypothetical protein
MPNWCENDLVVTGPQEDLAKFELAFRGKRTYWGLSEWAGTGKTPEEIKELEAKEMEKAENAIGNYTFNGLYPIPEEVVKAGYAKFEKDPNQVYGYDWCWKYWGTKWDIDGDSENSYFEDGEFRIWFDTAWGPALELFEKVAADYPTLTFRLVYLETGMVFAGLNVWSEGILSETEEYGSEDMGALREFCKREFEFDPWDFGEEEESNNVTN